MGIRKLRSRQSLKFQAFSSCKRLSLLPDVISEFFPEQSAGAYFLSAREVAPFNGQSGKAAVLCVCMSVCMCVYVYQADHVYIYSMCGCMPVSRVPEWSIRNFFVQQLTFAVTNCR